MLRVDDDLPIIPCYGGHFLSKLRHIGRKILGECCQSLLVQLLSKDLFGDVVATPSFGGEVRGIPEIDVESDVGPSSGSSPDLNIWRIS